MASKALLVVVAMVAVVLPELAMAKQFVVGDEQGWHPGVNYTEWATGKMFMVGDSLAFNYSAKFHNVFKVSGPQFKACQVPTDVKPMNTGFDVVTLAQPGKKWYLCGVADHCSLGQKLVITVMASSESPMPTPPSPPQTGSGTANSPYFAVFFAAFAVLMRAIV